MMAGNYCVGRTIDQWEGQFWTAPVRPESPLPPDEFPTLARYPVPVYDAGVDTTFCLVNNEFPIRFEGRTANGHERINHHYRLAGECTMYHLPWHLNHWRTFPMHELQAFADYRSFSTTVKALYSNRYVSANRVTGIIARRAFWLPSLSSSSADEWWVTEWETWNPSWYDSRLADIHSVLLRICPDDRNAVAKVTATLLTLSIRQDKDPLEWSTEPSCTYDFLERLYASSYWIGCALGERCLFRSELATTTTRIIDLAE